MQNFATFGFGLLLGVRHAFEADHLIAMVTMLTHQKNSRKAALVGTFWGLGHTITLLVVGLSVLLLKLSIPTIIEKNLEGFVGIMLIILGIQTVYKRVELHKHSHSHDGVTHSHIHQMTHHQHGKSFVIGMVHGLAGSGALMVLVLSLVKSAWEGVIYILCFGVGSTVSMTMMSMLIGIPLAKHLSIFMKMKYTIRLVAGLGSILVGIYILLGVL